MLYRECFQGMCHWIFPTLRSSHCRHHHPHFREEEPEVPSGKVTWSRSHSQWRRWLRIWTQFFLKNKRFSDPAETFRNYFLSGKHESTSVAEMLPFCALPVPWVTSTTALISPYCNSHFLCLALHTMSSWRRAAARLHLPMLTLPYHSFGK